MIIYRGGSGAISAVTILLLRAEYYIIIVV